jgi:hypothetical protein
VQATIHPYTFEVARLVLGTFEGVYGLCGAELLTSRVISSPRRGSTPVTRAAQPHAKFVTCSQGTESATPYRWSDAFHWSRLSPVIFVIAEDFVEPVREVLEANGVSLLTRGSMLDDANSSAALLDGLVIHVQTHRFPAGQLSSGWRVLGYRPMRLLCLLMGLEAPRGPLRGERVVATVEDLLEALACQHEEPASSVQDRAKQGLAVADRVDLLVLVRELFGEEYLPTPLSRDLNAALPAISSRWAFSGFSRLAEEELSSVGIDVEEVMAWKGLGLSRPCELIAVHPYGLRTICEWVKAGFAPMQPTHYLSAGGTLDQPNLPLVLDASTSALISKTICSPPPAHVATHSNE